MKTSKSTITYKCAECGEQHTTEKEYTALPYKLEDITIGCSSEVIKNPFSGESYELDCIEEAVYSVIKGAEWALHEGFIPIQAKTTAKDVHNMFVNGTDWFRSNNVDAYMKLLD